MKTKEEIEELDENKFNEKYYPISRQGFIEGYNQCQLDMAKDVEYWQSESDHWYQQAIKMADKKYTEEDMLKCWNTAWNDAISIDFLTYEPTLYEDFIESLNKQD